MRLKSNTEYLPAPPAALRKVPLGAWFPLALGSALTLFMILWTWGRELEDSFDTENKRNLSRIIFRRYSPSALSDEAKKARGDFPPPAFKLVPLPEEDEPSILGLEETDEIPPHPQNHHGTILTLEEESALFIRGQSGDLVELQRIPTLAIFHKTTDGKGTPFAFNVFMRQVPALPRVVVSI
jgi:KUP system potassium uptake protein